jgi:hypothetical protein
VANPNGHLPDNIIILRNDITSAAFYMMDYTVLEFSASPIIIILHETSNGARRWMHAGCKSSFLSAGVLI